MRIKTVIISLLVVVNVVLLSGLVLEVWPESKARAGTAYGQAMYGSPKYLMVVGRFRETEQALYVVSLERRMLAALTFDQARKRLTYNGRVSLSRDFQ